VTGKISQPFNITGEMYRNFVYFNLSVSRYSMERQEDKNADPNGNKNFSNLNFVMDVSVIQCAKSVSMPTLIPYITNIRCRVQELKDSTNMQTRVI
jgi:hypothetical protein